MVEKRFSVYKCWHLEHTSWSRGISGGRVRPGEGLSTHMLWTRILSHGYSVPGGQQTWTQECGQERFVSATPSLSRMDWWTFRFRLCLLPAILSIWPFPSCSLWGLRLPGAGLSWPVGEMSTKRGKIQSPGWLRIEGSIQKAALPFKWEALLFTLKTVICSCFSRFQTFVFLSWDQY